MKGDNMRVFIGIEFNHDIKDYLSGVQQGIQQTALKGNFTLSDNFHLTLKFIGEVRESDLQTIEDLLYDVSQQQSPFAIKIGGLNSFLRKDKHIVYVDVVSGKESLTKLAKAIEQALIQAGFEIRTDKFKPHITLGREVVLNTVSLVTPLNHYPTPIIVNKVTLFLSSRDSKNVLRYTPLYDTMLLETKN
jgi:RNA 2',3'-cyclic 3'-phosphodiesterase